MPQLGLTGLARIPLTLLRTSGEYGLDRQELMRGAGLSEEELRDPDARVEISKIWNLWRLVIERADDPVLGLHIGQSIEIRQLGLVGYTMYHSRTVDESLERLARYSRIISKVLRVTFRRGDDTGHLAFEHVHPFDCTQHPADARLASVIKGIREITRVPIAPLEVGFPYRRPVDVSEHRRFFNAPLKFDEPRAEFALGREDLARPVVAADETLGGYLDKLAEETLDSMNDQDALVLKVRQALWSELSGGKPTIGKIADVLGVSVRTLQRRLHEDGTSFADVLENFRRDMSVRLLRDRGLAVYEVAFLLGYSEPSTFFRAFRRWVGMAPQEFRKSLDPSATDVAS